MGSSMGAGPDRRASVRPGPAAGATARANVLAARTLLDALRRRGLTHLVVCPGSRSAPLAVAAALLESRGLRLHTAIDERSAAFFALGLGRALGVPAAVVTTSGTAVAQLLPAAVEADLGTIPLLLLSADRPERLKDCGANQAVPQERFLLACSRRLLEGPAQGLALAAPALLEELAAAAMAAACGDGHGAPAGPVHCNLPFEEPLHVGGLDLEALNALPDGSRPVDGEGRPSPPERDGGLDDQGLSLSAALPPVSEIPRLDPDRPGVVVAGPWRGTPRQWSEHLRALRRWQRRSGWPVLADVLSGLRGLPDLEVVGAYDPLLERPDALPAVSQVLRLGSLPASRRLQGWLEACGGRQVLVSQGDPRRLDPLGTVAPADQWSGGLAAWVAAQLPDGATAAAIEPPSPALAQRWRRCEDMAQRALDRELGGGERTAPDVADAAPDRGLGNGGDPGGGASGLPEGNHAGASPSEPWLARALSRLLPPDLPLMLASSSPVRDWESFADPRAPWRPCHGFRGASGIDGTLSLACGLAEALGQLVLVSGDLALLHDANGWLWARGLRGRLTVVLIENGGGGIFEQLPIRTEPPERLDFERLFAMPQAVDQVALAALHGVPGRRVACPGSLAADLAWALEQPVALLEVRTQRRSDAALRRRLRRAVAMAVSALEVDRTATPSPGPVGPETPAGRMAGRDPLLP